MLPYVNFQYLALGPIKIYTWGFFVSLGFLAAVFFLIKKYPQEKDRIIDLLLYVLLGSILGARLFFIAFYGEAPFRDILKIWQGGMSSFGGFIGGTVAIFIYSFVKKIKLRALLDKIALALPLGLAIARIGCFLINDHPGIKTTISIFSVAYPDGPRFDLGFLLMIFNLLLFLYLFFKGGKENYLESFLFLYGIGRFFLDFLRVGEAKAAGLVPSQYGSIVMIGIALFLIIKNKRYGFLG
ncbi:MAG: prolipoprotein diacylglyceryl transferase family protein [Patescibacteria group bacterium]